jgi:3,4-dihydroxy 2-butanone 4-phosphate synthase/GTP cyclohydrolase II
MFPLRARPGGVLVRAGQTEAAVDLAKMCGMRPGGVICEIMNDDGTMARLPDLVAYAQRHNLKLGTIADLIAYRRTTERLVKPVEQGLVRAPNGYNWRMIAYQSQVDQVEHLAMVKGDVSTGEPVLVRMHAVDTVTDVVGGEHLASLHGAMTQIDEAGRGVVVLIRESRNTVVSERIRDLVAGRTAAPTLRDYGIGAQILTDLGVKDMILLSNHKRTIVGLEGYGLNVVEQRAIEGTGEK